KFERIIGIDLFARLLNLDECFPPPAIILNTHKKMTQPMGVQGNDHGGYYAGRIVENKILKHTDNDLAAQLCPDHRFFKSQIFYGSLVDEAGGCVRAKFWTKITSFHQF